ncbi:diadenylate cyclase CdaA [Acidaminococcus timonensis]|uniref:diadenylate cyclase CdaA n=1 Tax=Acidaminococcus timonensis TaxID=1871002 RepID=UPI00308052C0
MGGHIFGLIHTITFLDVIDILVVAFFLNKIYQMLKNTRAASLVKGLLMLLVVMLVSKWLNLYVINWLLEKFMTIVMFALPVVFQPELRRALEQIGRGKLFRRSTVLNELQVENMLEAVATTADDLSRNKIGALMVFERETGLDDYIETGIPIDGLISTALFENIFIPNTPLHDGAVIIRGDRIAAASCLLPLTEARNLSQELGTRHRAAIGLSEQTDALILLVSEETGTISLARGGALQRYLTHQDVKDLLRPVMKQPMLNWKDALLAKMKGHKTTDKNEKGGQDHAEK